MANLTLDRKTDRMNPEDAAIPLILSFPVKADEVLKAGAMVMTLDGYALEAADGYGLSYTTGRIYGRCEKAVDNTDGDDGDINVDVRPGAYFFSNDSVAPVTMAYIGATVYCKDSHTVSRSANGGGTASRLSVGIALGIRADGQVAVLIV